MRMGIGRKEFQKIKTFCFFFMCNGMKCNDDDERLNERTKDTTTHSCN